MKLATVPQTVPRTCTYTVNILTWLTRENRQGRVVAEFWTRWRKKSASYSSTIVHWCCWYSEVGPYCAWGCSYNWSNSSTNNVRAGGRQSINFPRYNSASTSTMELSICTNQCSHWHWTLCDDWKRKTKCSTCIYTRKVITQAGQYSDVGGNLVLLHGAVERSIPGECKLYT